MLFNDFALLSVNVMTISNKMLAKTLSDMAVSLDEQAGDHVLESDYLKDVSGSLSVSSDALSKSLDDAYGSIVEFEHSFRRAYQCIDHKALTSILNELSASGVSLSDKLVPSIIDSYVHLFSDEARKPHFESLRALIDSAFYDSTEDIVSEAVANDDATVLEKNSEKIVSDSISVEDIGICVMCEKIEVFKWLVSKRKLNGDELLSVMNNADDDPQYFYGVLDAINPDEASLSQLCSHYANDEAISLAIKVYMDGD